MFPCDFLLQHTPSYSGAALRQLHPSTAGDTGHRHHAGVTSGRGVERRERGGQTAEEPHVHQEGAHGQDTLPQHYALVEAGHLENEGQGEEVRRVVRFDMEFVFSASDCMSRICC